MVQNILGQLQKRFLLQRIDCGKYASFKVGMLAISLECYEVPEFGRLSLIKGKAVGGLIKLESAILTPIFRDLPLLSVDMITVLGKNITILELYDTRLKEYPIKDNRQKILQIEDYDTGSHWYDSIRLPQSVAKKVKKRERSVMEYYVLHEIDEWCQLTEWNGILAEGELMQKKEKTINYVNGLLEHGGQSTDVFVKHIGEKGTRDLFFTYLFGLIQPANKNNNL